MREERAGIGTGILLITVGLLFVADRQGWLSFIQLWPVILIVLGATMLVFPEEPVHVGVVAGGRHCRQVATRAIALSSTSQRVPAPCPLAWRNPGCTIWP
ncbi:MAG: DUF5668 domain-containing protein, partial [Acidobacteriota bacterium]